LVLHIATWDGAALQRARDTAVEPTDERYHPGRLAKGRPTSEDHTP
jgi:hypothetical protein